MCRFTAILTNFWIRPSASLRENFVSDLQATSSLLLLPYFGMKTKSNFNFQLADSLRVYCLTLRYVYDHDRQIKKLSNAILDAVRQILCISSIRSWFQRDCWKFVGWLHFNEMIFIYLWVKLPSSHRTMCWGPAQRTASNWAQEVDKTMRKNAKNGEKPRTCALAVLVFYLYSVLPFAAHLVVWGK